MASDVARDVIMTRYHGIIMANPSRLQPIRGYLRLLQVVGVKDHRAPLFCSNWITVIEGANGEGLWSIILTRENFIINTRPPWFTGTYRLSKNLIPHLPVVIHKGTSSTQLLLAPRGCRPGCAYSRMFSNWVD